MGANYIKKTELLATFTEGACHAEHYGCAQNITNKLCKFQKEKSGE